MSPLFSFMLFVILKKEEKDEEERPKTFSEESWGLQEEERSIHKKKWKVTER